MIIFVGFAFMLNAIFFNKPNPENNRNNNEILMRILHFFSKEKKHGPLLLQETNSLLCVCIFIKMW